MAHTDCMRLNFAVDVAEDLPPRNHSSHAAVMADTA